MQTIINLAALTGGINVPSARFRVRQYIPFLRQQGIRVKEFYSIFGSYPPVRAKYIRPLWALATLAQRVPHLSETHGFHITLLQRELLSKFMTLERFTKRPRILDVDDAIWLNRPGFAKKLAQSCDAVICGNSFLTENFSTWNQHIYTLPTAVDAMRFRPIVKKKNREIQTIVWSGTSSGHCYLLSIEEAIQKVFLSFRDVKLRVISDQLPAFRWINPRQVEFVPWTPQSEVKGLQSADIGIMPLDDDLWAKGKCSYKMLTYMACGLPVVVSPVGMNKELIENAPVGLPAMQGPQWMEALSYLLNAPDEACKMGDRGRKTILQFYTLEIVGARLAAIIRTFV